MNKTNNGTVSSRWVLIKAATIFQLKLGLDAVRDLLLSPVAMICVLFDLIKGHTCEQSYFHQLMNLGHKSDDWLNLFGTKSTKTKQSADDTDTFVAATVASPADNSVGDNSFVDNNIDQLFDKVEAIIKEQHDKGGLTASAKTSIDRYLNKMLTAQKVSPALNNKEK